MSDDNKPLDPNREANKRYNVVPIGGDNRATPVVTVDHISSIFICEGVSAKEIADRFNVSVAAIERIIKENKLEELRAAHIKYGLHQLQSVQVAQAEKLMTMENQFKRMRIIQLEKILESFVAYYARHGHYYKIHPVSGEILIDTNGLPMPLKLPDVTKELSDLKESVQISEGLQNLLGRIDSIIHPSKQGALTTGESSIDISDYNALFKKKSDVE